MSHSTSLGRYALVLGLLTLHCGGAQFTTAPDGQGGSGRSGGSKNDAPAAGDSGDDPVDPSRGGSSSNGGTAHGGDTAPDPGADGGDSSVVSNAGRSGSSTTLPDPVVEAPIQLDLTGCGADAFGTGIMPTLYSTLDNAAAITDPAIGVLGFVGNAEGDYHGDHCGTAINIDQSYDYVKYHYQDEGTRHFNPMVGAMDFWYRPSYAHTDGVNHHLFGTANWQTAGGFRLRKAAGDLENAFQVMIASSTFQVLEIKVPADKYAFSPGVWTRISLVWYLSLDFQQRYVRLFLDGTEAGEVSVPVTFQMAPDANGFMMLGVWDFNDPGHASGWIDDFKIFGRGP